ncbi:hypothetical protein LCGC14_2330080 [marine sediment metagenome]|uniref:Uncharacterized protein n=1 Tax=marine sediment metagenome TaxID=412755 RepID=A0A0F9CF34_9ZZZZ
MDNVINLAQEREKRVVEIVVDEIDFDKLREFLDTLEPDDYDMRLDALSLAIKQVSTDAYYYGPETVVSVAKEFYEFLKDS